MKTLVIKSLWLLASTIVICCLVYPLVVWAIGQTFFSFTANGSMVRGPDGKLTGSLLIAQPFTKDEYFWPRPSAASYDASASASSALAASNYLLRDRVARMLGPIVKYASGPKKGQLVASDIEAWFQQDRYQGNPHIVAQWADNHNELAQNWVSADPSHAAYVNDWAKNHKAAVAAWVKQNPATPQPQASDLAVLFFENFSKDNPGKFSSVVTKQMPNGKTQSVIEPVASGSDVQSIFFDMWRQDHATADLANVPGDMVTTSGSGLDPDITLENAEYQLDRVASKWAVDLKRDPVQIHGEIDALIRNDTYAPMGGLFGEKMVNILRINLDLCKRYGNPQS
ncbi:MAG: potassium-transporting ATPase subunit C [Candidatus Binataceae bacterium]